MGDEVDKTFRIIPFTGKHEDWRMWSRKMLARATMKGYRLVMEGKEEAPPHDEDLDLIADQKTRQKMNLARTKNIMAYNELLLACQDEVCFGVVDEAITEDQPEGDARKAWENLKAKFEPKTGATKVQLKLEFSQCKLATDQDADEWMSSLERLRQKLKVLGAIITDEDLIIHVLNNVTPEYELLVETLENEVGAGLTVEKLRERLRAKYQRIKKGEKVTEDIALATKGGKFKGLCTTCGKQGHKGADCWQNPKNKDKRPKWLKEKTEEKSEGKDRTRIKGDCFYCKKPGHREQECFKKKREQGSKKDDSKQDGTSEAGEVVLMTKTKQQGLDKVGNIFG